MSSSEYLKNFWNNASEEDKNKRLKLMREGRKKADLEGKGKERILKGKENQKNRIIKERINSLKDFSYVLPYNDFRKLNIFLNSEDEEVVNIAIEYIKHKYNEFAKNINDSNSSTSHMSMFNKYWKSEYIEGTDLYLELFNWKQKVIKEFKEKSYIGYGKPLHHSKLYLNLPDEDIVEACIEYRQYLYNKMVKEIESIEDQNLKHKRQALTFNKYYELEEIKETDLYIYLTDWKNKEIEKLNNRSYIKERDRKHILDYLISISKSKNKEYSVAGNNCLKYYIDNYILTSIDESNTRMSSFVVLILIIIEIILKEQN